LTVVSAILAYDANVHIFDSSGCTSLMLAVEEGNEGCVRMLVEAGADVDAMSRFGATALDLAVLSKQKACGVYLHSIGAYCNNKKYPTEWLVVVETE
jgi:ankyrin repeat protein